MSLIVESITLEGFLSYKGEQTLVLGGRGPVAVCGPNGVGKSTVASKALTWCFYGKTPPEQIGNAVRSQSGKEIVNDDSKEARVNVKLRNTVTGAVYEIERHRTRSKADRIEATGPGAENTQDWVERLIGGDFDVFTRTVVRGQSNPWNFAGSTDARKREILDVVSGAEKLIIPHTRAKEIARARKVIAESHGRSVADAERRKAALNLDDLQARAQSWEADRQTRLKNAREELQALETTLGKARALDAAQEGAQAKRDALRAAAPTLDLDPYHQAERAAHTAVAHGRAAVRAAQAAQAQAASLVAQGKCPTCQKPIEAGDPIHNVATVTIETTTLDAQEQALVDATDARKQAEAWLKAAEADHRAKLDALPAAMPPQSPAAEAAVIMGQRRIEEIENASNPWQAQADQARGQLHSLEREIVVLRELQSEAEREQRIAEAWVAALAPKGARAHLAEGALAAIEAESNRWLTALSGGTMVVGFSPTTTTAKGAVKEEIETTIEHKGKQRSMVGISGGQKARVNFATDLGVAAAFSRGGSLALSLLVLDEQVFSGLDEDGQRQVVHAVAAAGVADVVVIDHDPRLSAALPRTVTVKAGPDGYSEIEEG